MKEKKMNLDVLRLIATFMVVAIHIYPLADIHEYADYMMTRVLFRVAVPFFFMITGYYVLDGALKDVRKLKSYTMKILKLYLISIVIYLPINIYNGYFHNCSFVSIVKDLVFNGTMYHLWYFPALLMGIWIVYFLLKKLDVKRGC